MQRLLTRLAFLFLVLPSLAIGQAASPSEEPLETTVCGLSDHPSRFDGELIQVRGYVTRGFEDFTLHDSPSPFASSCKARIWLEPGGDGKGPRNYMVVDTERLYNAPAEWQEQGRIDSVRLVKDQTYSEMMEKLKAFRSVQPDGNGCTGLWLCALYRVQVTITGRFFRAHNPGWDNGQYFTGGYGHLGCCHMLVIQQVTGLNAERTAVPDDTQAFTCSKESWLPTAEERAALDKIKECSAQWDCKWIKYLEAIAAHWGDHVDIASGPIPLGFTAWTSADLTLSYTVLTEHMEKKKGKQLLLPGFSIERVQCRPSVP
jgi:hypothetical protein